MNHVKHKTQPLEGLLGTQLIQCIIFIDREAGEIRRLVVSVCPSVHLSTLSRLNRMTYDLNKDAYDNSNFSMIICRKLLDQGLNPTISDLVVLNTC